MGFTFLVARSPGHVFFLGVARLGLASLGVAQSPWSSDPLVLWSLDPLVFGYGFWKVINTAKYSVW